MRRSGFVCAGLLVGMVAGSAGVWAQLAKKPADVGNSKRTVDTDLMEISVPALEGLYGRHAYTVVQVTRW